MPLVLLKLVLTPPLIGGASLVARRWGPLIGGWVISLPLTSGPVTLFVALDRGPSFGAATATAALAGNLAIVAFCLAFSWTALGTSGGRRRFGWRRRSWPAARVTASGAWALVAIALQAALSVPVAAIAAIVIAGIALGGAAMPPAPVRCPTPVPAWDVPLRMALGTSVVVLLTAVAPIVGATLSGLLAMLPVIGTVLAVFAFHRDGAANGVAVLRGIMGGLFGTAAFLAVLAATLASAGIVVAFGAACAAVLVLQVATLRVLTRPSNAPAPAADPRLT